jgi:hypothetical protein
MADHAAAAAIVPLARASTIQRLSPQLASVAVNDSATTHIAAASLNPMAQCYFLRELAPLCCPRVACQDPITGECFRRSLVQLKKGSDLGEDSSWRDAALPLIAQLGMVV